MSKWDKLIARICALSKDMRFDELRKVLESYGYVMYAPRSGSSHYTFRKAGFPFRSCRAALPAAKRWKPLWRTHRMPKKPGWKQPSRTV